MTSPSDKSETLLDMVVPEEWEQYGVNPDIALAIAQGFPHYWLQAAELHDLDHANNIAEEMARQERQKHFQVVARTKMPPPFEPSAYKVPSKQKELFDEYLKQHYPKQVKREPQNPFFPLLDKSSENEPVSFAAWHAAATELATGLIKFGKRISVSKRSPSKQRKLPGDIHLSPALPHDLTPPIESASEPTRPVPTTESNEPRDEDQPSIDISSYPGRFEFDEFEGEWRER